MMTSHRRICFPSLVVLVAWLAWPLLAQAETMSLQEVIDSVLRENPDLAIAHVDSKIAEADIQLTEGMLDPVITGGVSVSEEQAPVASLFQPTKTQSSQITANINKPLASGGALSASAAFTSTKQSYANPVAASFALINPQYRNQLNISYRHPLLKGAGRPDYHEGLIAAKASHQAATLNRRIIAQRLILQALNLYYQLAADDINIRIAEGAVRRARKLLSYQRLRANLGLIEPSDRLQAEALLAARKTALAQARARRAADATALNRLMRRAADAPIEVLTGRHFPGETPNLDEAMAISMRLRPEFKALDARLQAAKARLASARDQQKMQLDLIAQLGTRTLDGNAAGALSKSASIHDHFVSLALEMSDSLNNNRAKAGLRKAELARERIVAERIQLQETIRDELANAITAIDSNLPALAAAEAQLNIERKKFQAEMRKYREGRSDMATLIQFEGELSNAELQAELLRLNLERAERQLAWAEGLLLQSWNNREKDREPEPR